MLLEQTDFLRKDVQVFDEVLKKIEHLERHLFVRLLLRVEMSTQIAALPEHVCQISYWLRKICCLRYSTYHIRQCASVLAGRDEGVE